MGILRYVTLTGADEATDLKKLVSLAKRYEFAEWGVLYSPERAGKGGRYPSVQWLEAFAKLAKKEHLNVALHICGKAVQDLLEGVTAYNWNNRPAAIARLFELAGQFGRVQINVRADAARAADYRKLVNDLHRTEARTRVIFQWNEKNAAVCEALSFEPGFETLVDASGGRGVVPSEWPNLARRGMRRVGFAGGLGPENILEQLRAIDVIQQEDTFWLDMESKVRTADDQFDLFRCEHVLEAVCEGFLKPQRRQAMANWGEGTRNVRTLTGPWLDWWVARATGRANKLSAPPLNWSRPTHLWRQAGQFLPFQPTEDKALAVKLLREERIAMMPGKGESWSAFPIDKPKMTASHKDFIIAGLRAIVLKEFGATVPVNAYWEDGLTPST
ncbi:hypothetical protein D3C71_24410 [compost metagenome]